MILAHGAEGWTPSAATLIPSVVAGLLTIGYLTLAARQGRGGREWSRWRTGCFLAGIVLLVAGLLPQLLPLAPGDFRTHMVQHLLIGMLAPLGLVLGAPMTLILRAVPSPVGRRIGWFLRSRPAHLVGHPVTALALSIGGLAALYFTPLYVATTTSPVLHHLVHAHFLVAGYLFAWAIAGPDPAPRRPSVPARLVVLGVAIAAHSTLAQLMYAGVLVQVPAPTAELRGAAEIMYYGGDIAELLLALALVTTWHPRRAAPLSARPNRTRADTRVPTSVVEATPRLV